MLNMFFILFFPLFGLSFIPVLATCSLSFALVFDFFLFSTALNALQPCKFYIYIFCYTHKLSCCCCSFVRVVVAVFILCALKIQNTPLFL